MQRPQPMNRLLQGDVGAGKTIVALMAALVAMENGLQVAFMAPTEILAEQHFFNIRRLLEPSRFRVDAADRRHAGAEAARDRWRSSPAARCTWSSARTRWSRRTSRSASSGWRSSTSSIASACCSARRCARRGCTPTCCVMTATPIPRTLALTTYGDLDVSVMREMPPGRQPIATIAQARSRGATRSTTSSASELEQGRQAYVIYPLVEESEKVDLQGGDRDGRPPARRTSSRRIASRCCTAG